MIAKGQHPWRVEEGTQLDGEMGSGGEVGELTSPKMAGLINSSLKMGRPDFSSTET